MPSTATIPLILASASPRRKELLAQIGVTPEAIIPAHIDESQQPGDKPPILAKRLAEAKAMLIASENPQAFVLGADTLVCVGRRILGKAEDQAQARRFLHLLSGRRHRVYGGLCLIAPGGKRLSRLVCSRVQFKRLTASETEAYLACDEWRGKAGAYAIQGRAGAFVRQINGSYTNIVGLSLYETKTMLHGLGYR